MEDCILEPRLCATAINGLNAWDNAAIIIVSNGLCHSDEASFSSSWVTILFLISIASVTISLYRGRSSLHALPIVFAAVCATSSLCSL